MFDFSNQTVVVTGGTRGIGRAVSEAFLGTGATVIAVYASNDDAANSFKDEAGERLHLAKLDVSDETAVEEFFRDFQEKRTGGDLQVFFTVGNRHSAVRVVL